jgi:biopolymer transport protein TolQ
MSGEINIFSLIMDAGPVVKMVMLILVLASIVSWGVIIDRARITKKARRLSGDFEDDFWGGTELATLYKESKEIDNGPLAAVFLAGFREYLRLRESDGDAEGILQGAQRAMRVAINRETEKLETFLPTLATIGSTSPYVGLFGTVWGIMTSFQALGGATQASLSMVAPGISEALVATAMGLFAAIPAVVAYNRYSNEVYRLEGRFEDFSEQLANILQRQLTKRS